METDSAVMHEFLHINFPHETGGEQSSTSGMLGIAGLPGHLDELLKTKVQESQEAKNDLATGRLGPEKACFDLKLSVGVFGVDAEKLQFISRSNFATGVGNTCVFKGKWMYEVILGSSGIMQLGWGNANCKYETVKGVGDMLDSYGYDGRRKCKWNCGRWQYGEEWIAGDVIQCMIDLDEGTVTYARNGKSLGVAFNNVKVGPTYAYFPAVSLSPGDIVQANFGIVPFQYPVKGYSPVQEPPNDDLTKAKTLLECLERLLPYFMQVDNQPSKCPVSRQHLLLICDCILQRLGPLLAEDQYICDTLLAEFFDKHTDLEHPRQPQPMVKALLDVCWALLEEHELKKILLNVTGIFGRGYRLSSPNAKLEIQLKYLKLNLIILQHERTRKLLLKLDIFETRFPHIFRTRMPDDDVLDEMIPDADLNMEELTKCPVVESTPYKTNMEKVIALLKQADDLRITIIQTFMTDDDTTYGPTTLSLFVERIQKFVSTSLQTLGVRSLNAVLSGFFFSLLPVVKQHWERAVKENPEYVAFEDAYIPLHLFYTDSCLNMQRIGGVTSYLDKEMKDELAKVGIVKPPKAEATEQNHVTPSDAPTKVTTSDPGQVTTSDPGQVTTSDQASSAETKKPKLEEEVKSADSTDQSDAGAAAAASPDCSQSEVDISNLSSDEPMRKDLLQLVDAMVMLYSISTHKVMQDPFAMQLLIKEYESNIKTTKEKLEKCPEDEYESNIKSTKEKLEKCPEGLTEVRSELERAKCVFLKRLSEHIRKLIWIDAGSLHGQKPQHISWLNRVLLRTFEKSIDHQKLFSYLPEFYVTACCQTDDFVFRCGEQKILPAYDEGMRRFLILMCTLIGDKRIINQMIREQIFESLAFYLKGGKYIPTIEGLPEEVRGKFLSGVLDLHDSQMWGSSSMLLVKFWRGCGFAFRYAKSPGLKENETDAETKKKEEKEKAEGSSVIFQKQLGEILRKNDKLALQFLHSVLNKLNTVFSEFIGMIQQFVHALKESGKVNIDVREIGLCSTCYNHTVGLLRVLEMVCNASPEVLTDWSKPLAESMLCRVLQSVIQILNRITVKGSVNVFDEICKIDYPGFSEIDHFPIMAAIAGVIVQLVDAGSDLSKERASSILLQDQGFQLSSLEFMLSGEGPRGAIVKHKKQADVDFSFRKYAEDITEEEVKQLEGVITYLRSKQLLMQRQPSLNEEDLCTICYASIVAKRFYPCEHVSCGKCITQHLLNSLQCFFCKEKIVRIESINPSDTSQPGDAIGVESLLAELERESSKR